jgi:hypothetical protein
MNEFNWECPYCRSRQTVTDPKYHVSEDRIDVGDNADGNVGFRAISIGCSNPECKKVTVIFEYGTVNQYSDGGYHSWQKTILGRQFIPDSAAKPQPEYIPEPIRNDYAEACLIRDLSPKASATLSRRCLQGMIRDFCKVSKSRLVDEVSTLKAMVDAGSAPAGVSADSIDAIDALRKIGNIGAHMEKDINIIVDVDPNEAQALIELIESLFDEWYIARHKRQQRFAKVAQVATQKEADKVPTSLTE